MKSSITAWLLLISTAAPVSADKPSAFPPSFSGIDEAGGILTLESGKWSEAQRRPFQWAYAVADGDHDDVHVRATVRILEPAKRFGFFGSSWSVWPDQTYGDEGFEAGVLLRLNQSKDFCISRSIVAQVSTTCRSSFSRRWLSAKCQMSD